MKNLTETEFKFYDECETIANYMEEHLYNTVQWQLLLDEEDDENYANEMHTEAMEQVIAIMATRMFNRPRRQLKIIKTNDND